MKLLSKAIPMLLAAALLFADCAAKPTTPAPTPAANAPQNASVTTETPVEPAANADWPDTLTIVLMPDEGNPDAANINTEFKDAMEAALGIKVEMIEAFEYAVGIEAMKSGKLDLLLVSPMSYYQAERVANIEPLVTTGTEGTTPYKTVFVTKSDRDDINSLEDLRDKTFAFVDPASSSGYLYPKAKLLSELGLDTDQLENPGYFFKTVTYSGKHDASLMGVSMGDYDAGAVALQIIDSVIDAGLIGANDLKIIGETDIIPSACYIMRAELPQSLKDTIKAFYLGYDDPTYFAQFYQNPDIRYIEAYASDYDVVYEMVRLLKIEE